MVKFQTFQASQLASKHAEQAAYQQRAIGVVEDQLSMLRRLNSIRIIMEN